LFAKQREKRIIEPIFRGNYEKQVKVGRLPKASHQTAEPTVMEFSKVSKIIFRGVYQK